jgi:hypothetical protein
MEPVDPRMETDVMRDDAAIITSGDFSDVGLGDEKKQNPYGRRGGLLQGS